MRSRLRPLKTGLILSSALLASAAIFAVSPPPEPDVAPMILLDVEYDTDWNRIDDGIDERLREAHRRRDSQALAGMVEVETVFSRQIRQEEIDAFVELGGEIDHVYRAISYGWQGRVPLEAVELLAERLGDELVVIREHRELEQHLQTATINARARDVWAGSPLGLAGNRGSSSTRIAIVDTGIDASHTDLAGRQAFWKDYTTDNIASPTDIIGHGTHVAGIALGSGASQGGETGTGMTLRYSYSDNLSGAPTGVWAPALIEFRPGRTYTMTHTGVWTGGGQTTVSYATRAMGTPLSEPLTPRGPLNNSTSSGYSFGPFAFTVSGLQAGFPFLSQNSNDTIGAYSQSVVITNYHTPGDGFPAFSGVAPLNEWVGVKVFTNSGLGSTGFSNPAFDEMVTLRNSLNLRVLNLSLGIVGGPDSTTRQKVNTLAMNGIVPVVSAGNAGNTNIGDPGRAALAITVGAINSAQEVTNYSQPGATVGLNSTMDYKPDLVAPGGSVYYQDILSADTNESSAFSSSFPDQQANDLIPFAGTSMSAPMVSGAAALVIEALLRNGHAWNFNDSSSVLLVKSILSATASETNRGRELGATPSPTLQRANNNNPIPYPGKDRNEGYGALNIDAAVQAIENQIGSGYTNDDIILTNTANTSRAWAARFSLTSGQPLEATLDVPATHDMDLYLYSWQPGANGNPNLIAHSTNAGLGADQVLIYNPGSNQDVILVIKCISGTNTTNAATLTIVGDPPDPVPDTFSIH